MGLLGGGGGGELGVAFENESFPLDVSVYKAVFFSIWDGGTCGVKVFDEFDMQVWDFVLHLGCICHVSHSFAFLFIKSASAWHLNRAGCVSVCFTCVCLFTRGGGFD